MLNILHEILVNLLVFVSFVAAVNLVAIVTVRLIANYLMKKRELRKLNNKLSKLNLSIS